ncbi:sulfotransferase [bacterium]|nr:sulfotransferase [bacterium]
MRSATEMLPDFLIIGAMKCGTSTLAAQLGAQPGLFITTPKEPNFFSDDATFARGLSWYESLFDPAPQGALKGEASTHYTKLPTHPRTLERLLPVLPGRRLIYVIRNPIDRAVSHYIHEWTMGQMTGSQMSGTIDEAFARHPELVDYGRYAMQIEPWLDAFGPEAIFLTSLEAMTADPQGVLDRVGAFLGREELVWQEDKARQNVSAERVKRLPLQGLILDNPVARTLRRTLVPKSVRDRIRKARQMQARPDLTPALRTRLEAIFAEDHARLTAFFPDCPDIAPAYPFLGVGNG